jgi:Flp pilus assembly protein TadD
MPSHLPHVLVAGLVAAGLAWTARPGHPQDVPSEPPVAEKTPEDPPAAFARGQKLLESGDPAGAAEVFERMVAGGIEHPAVRSNLGAAYSQLGRFDEAIEQQRKALELSGGNATVRLNLAVALRKAGRIPDAAEEAAMVVAGDPDHRRAVLLLADCYLRMGRSGKVVELLDPLAGRAIDDEAVAYLLGTALMRQGELERAQRVIDGILRRETPQAHLLMATMAVAAGDCPRALAELDRAHALGPPLPTQGFLRGHCLMEESQWEGAMRAFEDEIELDPNHFEAQLFLGSLLHEESRSEEALAHFERAERLRPGHVSVRFGRGCALAALGRDAEALPLLEDVVTRQPGNLRAHVQLAGVYFRLGRPEDAAREREEVQELIAEGQARAAATVRDSFTETIRRGVAPEAGSPSPPP